MLLYRESHHTVLQSAHVWYFSCPLISYRQGHRKKRWRCKGSSLRRNGEKCLCVLHLISSSCISFSIHMRNRVLVRCLSRVIQYTPSCVRDRDAMVSFAWQVVRQGSLFFFLDCPRLCRCCVLSLFSCCCCFFCFFLICLCEMICILLFFCVNSELTNQQVELATKLGVSEQQTAALKSGTSREAFYVVNLFELKMFETLCLSLSILPWSILLQAALKKIWSHC